MKPVRGGGDKCEARCMTREGAAGRGVHLVLWISERTVFFESGRVIRELLVLGERSFTNLRRASRPKSMWSETYAQQHLDECITLWIVQKAGKEGMLEVHQMHVYVLEGQLMLRAYLE
jgi:hypothetical protein